MIDFLLNNLNNLSGLLIGISVGAVVTGAIVIWNHYLYKKVKEDFHGGADDNDKSKDPASKGNIEDKKDAVSYPDFYQV